MCQKESCFLVYGFALNEYKYCCPLLCCWVHFILGLLVQRPPQQVVHCSQYGAGRSKDPVALVSALLVPGAWAGSSHICCSGNNRTAAPVTLPIEEVLQTLHDLIAYFQPPAEEMQHEDKQNKLRSLKNRQNLFKEEVSQERQTNDWLIDWLIYWSINQWFYLHSEPNYPYGYISVCRATHINEQTRE